MVCIYIYIYIYKKKKKIYIYIYIYIYSKYSQEKTNFVTTSFVFLLFKSHQII